MTLVEIMVVIAIIGMLMGVVSVPVFRALQQARVDATAIELQRVASGLEAYAAQHEGAPPPSLDAALDWLPRQALPTDEWENPIHYEVPHPDGRHPFRLLSHGADGEPGGEGFDADLFFP